MSETKRGTLTIVIVLSGVNEEESVQAVGYLKSAAAVAASGIGCAAGGAHQYLGQVFDPRVAIDAHSSALRHVAQAVAAHEHGECDCDDGEVVSRVLVTSKGGDA